MKDIVFWSEVFSILNNSKFRTLSNFENKLLGNTCRVKNITCSDFGQCINDDSQEEGYVCYCEAGHVGEDCEIGKSSKSCKHKTQRNTTLEIVS